MQVCKTTFLVIQVFALQHIDYLALSSHQVDANVRL